MGAMASSEIQWKNPMAAWWWHMMQKVKQAGAVYVKAHRRKHKVG